MLQAFTLPTTCWCMKLVLALLMLLLFQTVTAQVRTSDSASHTTLFFLCMLPGC
jgi:hypothetical protein